MEEKPTRRRRRRKAEIDAHVAAWEASEQSVPHFAQEQGVPVSSLYQWIQARGGSERIGKRGAKPTDKRHTNARMPRAKAKVQPSAPNFAEVAVIQGDKRSAEVTIMTVSGHTITLEGDALEASVLKTVLEVVKEC